MIGNSIESHGRPVRNVYLVKLVRDVWLVGVIWLYIVTVVQQIVSKAPHVPALQAVDPWGIMFSTSSGPLSPSGL